MHVYVENEPEYYEEFLLIRKLRYNYVVWKDKKDSDKRTNRGICKLAYEYYNTREKTDRGQWSLNTRNNNFIELFSRGVHVVRQAHY